MGNVLKATSERLTSDQFREYINLLKGITYKLLLKRHIDVAVDMHQKIQTEDIDYLEGTTAGDILAKIRFKNTKDVLWNYVGTVPSTSEYNSDVVFSDELMDSNPRFWTIGQLMAGMNELERFRIEFFGTEPDTETQQTDEKRKAATIQATLAVFKSVFAQLPTEQTTPQVAPGAEQSPNISESLMQKYKSLHKKSNNEFPPDTPEFLEKIRSRYSRDLRDVPMESIEEIYFELFGRKMINNDPSNEPEANTSSTETSNNSKLAVEEPVVSKQSETNKTATVGLQTEQSEILSNDKRVTEPTKTSEVSSSDITATGLSKISVKGKKASKTSKTEKTSTKLLSKKRKSSTGKKLQKEDIKSSSNKIETSEPSVDKQCSEEPLALNPTLTKIITKDNSDSSIETHDPKNNSSLNIPIQMENKPFVYSDSLSEAFSINPVSVLKRNDSLTTYQEDSLVDKYITEIHSDSEPTNYTLNEPLYENINVSEPEFLNGNNDEPSEPDDLQ